MNPTGTSKIEGAVWSDVNGVVNQALLNDPSNSIIQILSLKGRSGRDLSGLGYFRAQ